MKLNSCGGAKTSQKLLNDALGVGFLSSLTMGRR